MCACNVKITPKEHIKIVLHYKIKGCIEVFIVLEKSELSQFFLRCCFYHPLLSNEKIAPCTSDVSWTSDEKIKYENHKRSEMYIYRTQHFDACSTAIFFHGYSIYSHVFYDLSYLHITHHVYPEDEDYFILFWFIYYTVSHRSPFVVHRNV